jgi:mono/diheme cytochrome c family protein
MDVCVDAGVTGKMELLRIFMLGLASLCASAVAQKSGETTFPPEQIKAGAEIYATNCATCHGNRMENPPWAIDLGTIPKNDRRRFVESVTNGKNNMPPWGDVLKPDDVEALWAYFLTGEK